MNDFDFLETNDRIRRLRKPPRQQIAGIIALITVGFAGVLPLGAWSAYQFHFKPLPPAPATPPVKPAPVVEVATRPAAPSPSKADLAEIERQRNADEFVAKVAAIPRRPEPNPDSIRGNAVPRQRFYDDVMHRTADEVLKLYGKPDSTQDGSSGATWYYDRRTYDPLVGKPDHSAQVVFGEGGVVMYVNFNRAADAHLQIVRATAATVTTANSVRPLEYLAPAAGGRG